LQPLEGIMVASPTVNPPGPLVASRVAEFGASVTRVEPPAGDPPPHASRARCLNTPLRAPARPSGTGYAGDAGMFGGAYPGCGIHESADGHVALSAVEPHFFEPALRAFGVDGCHDASRGAFVDGLRTGSRCRTGRYPLNRAQWRWSMPISGCPTWLVIAPDQPFISPKRPASSIYRRVTRCQAVRARLPGSRRQGKEIGSGGNGNARGCEVVRLGVRRDRLSGTTAASIAALNSTAGSSFGDPRGRGQHTRQASEG
jgi:crotonobetainyl-CoA:carnitine CoA-transferase CaiB-like acyl-CoA transferase